MKIIEALEIKDFIYTSTRNNYQVNDQNPSVMVINNEYDLDGNGVSILGFNLNYLTKKQKEKTFKNTYNYSTPLTKDEYISIIDRLPFLKRAIRRYKYNGIQQFSS